MKESKMSMIMRKQIDQSLRSGEPLPLPKPPRPNTSNDIDKETQAILERARNAKRKNLRQIESSGAYERSYFRPKVDNRMVSDKAKSRLQFTMAGIELPDPAIKPLRRTREDRLVTENDLINECESSSVFVDLNLSLYIMSSQCWIKSMSVPNGWPKWRLWDRVKNIVRRYMIKSPSAYIASVAWRPR